MQKITAAILLLAFCGQTFNQGLYWVDYLIDKAAYEKKCTNKSRPKWQCHGKCQLMKKIEEKEKQERGLPPEMKLAAKVEVLSSKSWVTYIINSPVNPKLHFISASVIGYPIDRPNFVFHPPNA